MLSIASTPSFKVSMCYSVFYSLSVCGVHACVVYAPCACVVCVCVHTCACMWAVCVCVFMCVYDMCTPMG